MSVQNLSNSYNTGTPILGFQIDRLSTKEKTNYEWGKKLAQQIESYVNGGTSSYFWVRNAQWKTNRNYAHGKIAMQRFMDLLEFNGKVNYANLNWQCIQIVNRIVSGLVGRWMARDEKIYVEAIDPLSQHQKQEEYEQIEFWLDYQDKIMELQEQSGIQIAPQGENIPQDKDQLRIWKTRFQRIPEEILYELSINDVLESCGWFSVLKEKMLHDSAECGFVGTYTYMDSNGVVHVEWLKPENCIYSYSNFPDFRDTTWRGYMRTMKVSELRRKYGKEFHPNNPHALTEENLEKIAATSKDYQLYDNVTWNTQWNVTFLRPYDEWNVDVIEFELKSLDSEPYTIVKTKQNGSTIIKKGVPKKVAPNEEVATDERINIYRGVYERTTQTMLEWGLKDNMIRPDNPKEVGNAEFSYSFYMVQNYDMTTIGIPQKLQEAADQMIIARLKIQQLIAKMIPAGAAINWDAIQEIDYGLGDGNKAIDVVKMFEQTGKLYWRGRDAEGNQLPLPYVEMPNSGFYNQLKGLIEVYQFHYQVMKDELGEDPNLVSQAVQPRVTAGNVEVSQQEADFATSAYYRAYVECMKDTAAKIACLVKDSVIHGAKVYREIIDKDQLDGRYFSTEVKLLPDQFQIQKFEAMLMQVVSVNPDFVMFVNPFELVEIAKENVKMAYEMFYQYQKKMLEHRTAEVQRNQQQTIQGQIESAKVAEEEKRKTKEYEMEVERERTKLTGLAQNQTAAVNLVGTLLKPSSEGVVPAIPAELKPFINAVIQNIMIGAVASTEEQKQQIIEQMQQAQMQEQMEQQAMAEQQQMQGQPMQQEQINQEPQVAA